MLAKKNGKVHWSEISEGCNFLKTFQFNQAEGFNTNSAEKRAKFHSMTMYDYVHWNWNNPNGPSSPYKYFGGIMSPCGKDENGDVIYEYIKELSI